MKPLVLTLMLVVATAALAGDPEEVQRLDREISVATWTGDAVWFEENLADDYVLISPTGAVKGKREVIRELATPGMRMEPFEPTEVQVRMYGDTAVVTGLATRKGLMDGKDISTGIRYTRVYTKRDGRWQVVQFQQTRVTPNAS